MVWGKASSTTLSSAGDSVSSGTFTASKCNQLMTHISDVGGQLAVDMRFNSDTGNNYAFRRNNDGGTDATTASTSNITLHSSEVTEDLFSNVFIINNSSNEKLVIGHTIQNHTLGAGNIPKRKEFVGKWANTSSQITQVDFSTYSGSGDYDTGSNLSVLGSEITPAAAITFPTNVQLGSRAEITDSRKMYSFSDISTSELKAYYNFDSTSGGLVNQATTGDGLGSSADGTNSNITLDTTNEKLGTGAYSFNGSSSVVEIGGQTTFTEINNPNQISTIVFWYKSSSSPSSTYDKIMGTVDQSASDRGFNIMRTGSSGGAVVSLTQGSGNKGLNDFTTTTGLFPVDGNWYHYAFKFDNLAGKLSIYKDGSLFEEENYASWTPATGGNTQRPFQFGKDTSNSKWFNGQLDDSAIYYRGLTVSEISFLYNSGTGATVDNAKGWQEIGA